MGLNKIEEIMNIFSSHGKASTPVAVIQNGTLPEQQVVVGTVESITNLTKEKNIEAPAIIVVGDVVRYAHDIQKMVARHIGRG
jgi:uroporphyrin-III C-methyltransferase